MPTEDPADNRTYCRAYYQRVKADPRKYAAFKAKKAAQQRLRRAMQKPKPVASPDGVRELTFEPEGADGDLSIGDLFG